MRVHQQPAYVLINRPYSETSWISEVFTRNHGRFSLIAKGARRQKSPFRGVLLSLQPLLISWSGKGEIQTLTSAELDLGKIALADDDLQGDARVCAFYCNELLVKLLHRHDPHPVLFDAYTTVLESLRNASNKDQINQALRIFELKAIKESGYAVDLERDSSSGSPIADHLSYRFVPQKGFEQCSADEIGAVTGLVVRTLASDSAGHGLNASQRVAAKELMRSILEKTLVNKVVHSRSLFFPKTRP